MQVGCIDAVAIGDRELPNAARCKIKGCGATKAAGPYDQRVTFEEALLRLDTEFIEQDVAAVAQELRILHNRLPRSAAGCFHFGGYGFRRLALDRLTLKVGERLHELEVVF